MKKKFIAILLISLINFVSIKISAQNIRRNYNIKESYYTNKGRLSKKSLLKRKDKITRLVISNYSDSIFPNNFISKFPNLVTLHVYGDYRFPKNGPVNYKFLDTIYIDTTRFDNLMKLEVLGIGGFNLLKFPAELSKLSNLSKLSINYTTLDSIPSNITQFNHTAKKLDFYGNCIVYIDSAIKELDNVELLDLAHNKFTNIPEALVDAFNVKKINLGNSYGSERGGLNFNSIDFYNRYEIEKLKILLSNCLSIGIGVRNCAEGDYVRVQIDKDLRKKKLIIGYKVFDCTGMDQYK